jgi:hypothetical protein
MFGRCDTDRPRGLAAQLAQNGKFCLDVVEARPNGLVKAFARFSRSDAARSAVEQLQVEPALQRADGLAKRGLCHPKLSGCARESARAYDGRKGGQVIEACH